jgi:hypothetical protein
MLPKEIVKDFNVKNTRMIEGKENANRLSTLQKMKIIRPIITIS